MDLFHLEQLRSKSKLLKKGCVVIIGFVYVSISDMVNIA